MKKTPVLQFSDGEGGLNSVMFRAVRSGLEIYVSQFVEPDPDAPATCGFRMTRHEMIQLRDMIDQALSQPPTQRKRPPA